MLMAVKRNFRYLITSLKCNLKSVMEYKLNFVIQTLFMFINNGFFLVFWLVVFSVNNGQLKEIGMQDIMYLWGFLSISYGITYFFFGGIRKINKSIISGEFDSYLLLPKSPLISILTSKCDFSSCGDLLYGILMTFLGTGGDLGKFSFGIILGLFGSIFYLSTEIIIRSLSVWLGDMEEVAERYMLLLLVNLSSYPEQIYSGVIKILIYTVVPAAYVSFLPLKIVKDFNISYVLLLLILGIIYLGTAIIVFNKAIKNYESGNNIAMKE